MLHKNIAKWVDAYKADKNKNQATTKLNNAHILLAKFFVSSNVSVIACENKYLRAATKQSMGKFALTKNILPDLRKLIKEKHETKLTAAKYVNLILDIWSSVATVPYLGLGVSVMYPNFTRETFIVGLEEMQLPQNAENCKLAVETIINKLEFDKSKIPSATIDQVKNLLKLFKPSVGAYYLEDSVLDQEKENWDSSDDDDDEQDLIAQDLECSPDLQLNFEYAFEREMPETVDLNRYNLDDETEFLLKDGNF